MKKIYFTTESLALLAELDERQAGLVARAAARYATDGMRPTVSDTALAAIARMFTKQIDEQAAADAARSETNKANGSKPKRKQKARRSDTQPLASVTSETHAATALIANQPPQPSLFSDMETGHQCQD